MILSTNKESNKAITLFTNLYITPPLLDISRSTLIPLPSLPNDFSREVVREDVGEDTRERIRER